MRIGGLDAIKTRDSRGEETISVFVRTEKGTVNASAPSGKSRGKHETNPFSTKGINFSISFLNMIGKKLVSERVSFNSFDDLKKAEDMIREFDKSENFSLLGGNALFALESALLKAMALDSGNELWNFLNPDAKSLPRALGNCIGGGMHLDAPRKSDFQEFLLCPRTKRFYDSYFANLQAYKEAKMLLIERDKDWKGQLTDERAMASTLQSEKILQLLRDACDKVNSKYGFDFDMGIDTAASTFFDGKSYIYRNPAKKRDASGQLSCVSELISKQGLFYIEDPFDEEDFDSFSKLLSVSKKCFICGDDLTTTNLDRLKIAVEKKAINAIIIKPNQNGSLLRTKDVLDFAKKNSITPIISHRSGETSDSTIADLAVAWEIPFIKTGILGTERMAKLHRLLRIEREIMG